MSQYFQDLKRINELFVILNPKFYGFKKTINEGIITIKNNIVGTVNDLDDENSPLLGLHVDKKYLPSNNDLDIDFDPDERNDVLYDNDGGYIVFVDEIIALSYLSDMVDNNY